MAVELFPEIVTTNFDDLFEHAARRLDRDTITIARDVDFGKLEHVEPSRSTVIYKLHGDLDALDCIVITEKDYIQLENDQAIQTHLRARFLEKRPLFVGYSLGDPDLLRTLVFCQKALGPLTNRAYAVVPGVEEGDPLVARLAEYNVDLISKDALSFLEELRQSKTRRSKGEAERPDGTVPADEMARARGEPRPGASYDLSQAAAVTFDVRSPAGATVQIGVAEPYKQQRVLEATMAERIPVGKATRLLAMIRLPDLEGLKEYIKEDTLWPEEGEAGPGAPPVRSGHLEVEFPPKSGGVAQGAEVLLAVDCPDFEPSSLNKRLIVPSSRNSKCSHSCLRRTSWASY